MSVTCHSFNGKMLEILLHFRIAHCVSFFFFILYVPFASFSELNDFLITGTKPLLRSLEEKVLQSR